MGQKLLDNFPWNQDGSQLPSSSCISQIHHYSLCIKLRIVARLCPVQLISLWVRRASSPPVCHCSQVGTICWKPKCDPFVKGILKTHNDDQIHSVFTTIIDYCIRNTVQVGNPLLIDPVICVYMWTIVVCQREFYVHRFLNL